MISLAGVAAQFTELALAVLLAPLLTGWVNQCRAWLQNRSAPPLLQPYRVLNKLFQKEVVLAHNASPLFRVATHPLTVQRLSASIPSCPLAVAAQAMIMPPAANDIPSLPLCEARMSTN